MLKVLVSCAVGFVFLVSLQIHGFSLPYWHKVIDGSQPYECLFGTRPQHIRADDWSLEIPTMLAQTAQEPPFPLVNQNIFLGQNMRAPIRAPVLSPLLLFQPSLWGFFLERDTGLSWLWWSLVFGVFVSAFLLFLEISRQNYFLSVTGGLLLVFSPFFQLWSFHKAEILIGALLSVVFFLNVLRAVTVSKKLLWALALGWSLGEFAFGHIYPPFQISMAYLSVILALLLTTCVERKLTLRINVFAMSVSVVVICTAVAFFLKEGGGALAVLSDTEYPGKRFSVGGGYPLWILFSNHFFIRHWVSDWSLLSNICESAYGFFFLPALAGYAIRGMGRNKICDPLFTTLLWFALVLLLFSCAGFSETLARYTLFAKVTPNRIGMPLLVIDIVLLVRLISNHMLGISVLPTKLKWLPALSMFAVLSIIGLSIHCRFPEMPTGTLLISPFLFSLAFYSLSETRFYRPVLVGLVLMSFIYAMSFNPIVRGGTEFLYQNPLSSKISELQRSNPTARWISYGVGPGGDLLRALGVPALGGHQGVPNFDLWRTIDPGGENYSKYNISGLVFFQPPEAGNDLEFIGGGNVLVVKINPAHSGLKSLGISHLLIGNQDVAALIKHGGFLKVFEYGNYSILERIH